MPEIRPLSKVMEHRRNVRIGKKADATPVFKNGKKEDPGN